jgi:hypothetical protein
MQPPVDISSEIRKQSPSSLLSGEFQIPHDHLEHTYNSIPGGVLELHALPLESVLQLIVTINVVPSSSILVTLMIEVIRSSETSVLSIVARRRIPQDGILHSQGSENVKSYTFRKFITVTAGASCWIIYGATYHSSHLKNQLSYTALPEA